MMDVIQAVQAETNQLVKYQTALMHLETATKNSRELDAIIAFATGWTNNCDYIYWGLGAPHWFNKDGLNESSVIGVHLYGKNGRLPFFTLSLDAAKSLIGNVEQPFVYMIQADFGGLHRVRLYGYDKSRSVTATADAESDALAFCKAYFKAMIELEKGSEDES